MKRLLLLYLFCLLLLGCSSTQVKELDVLSNSADFNFTQSFDLKEERSVTMAVEVYENGHFKEEHLMYFGNKFKGKGDIQFSYFRPDYSMNNSTLIDSFLIGAIQDEDRTISNKVIATSPYMGYVFKPAKEDTITQTGVYPIGVFGYLTNDDASTATSLFEINIHERLQFIEAYQDYPLVYIVVIEVR